MARADWLPIGPIKSVMEGHQACSLHLLSRWNRNEKKCFLNFPIQENTLIDGKNICVANSVLLCRNRTLSCNK